MIYILLLAVLIFSFGITYLFRNFALRKSIMDIPNHRSSHQIPTPRGGGGAIVITFFLGCLILVLLNNFELKYFFGLIGFGCVVALAGFVDDCSQLSAITRLVLQIVVSLCVIWQFHKPILMIAGGAGNRISWLILPALVFCFVWFINLFNFMDGIDGIASVEAITVSCGAALILWFNNGSLWQVQLLATLSMSTLGFLYWNWSPAKIFMGDCGSGFLGFSLGYLAILTTTQGAISPWSWLILAAVFIVDASATLFRRLFRGERIFDAHCTHCYQILSQKAKSHKKVSLGVLLINVFWLFPFAFLATISPEYSAVAVTISFLPLLGISYMIDRGYRV